MFYAKQEPAFAKRNLLHSPDPILLMSSADLDLYQWRKPIKEQLRYSFFPITLVFNLSLPPPLSGEVSSYASFQINKAWNWALVFNKNNCIISLLYFQLPCWISLMLQMAEFFPHPPISIWSGGEIHVWGMNMVIIKVVTLWLFPDCFLQSHLGSHGIRVGKKCFKINKTKSDTSWKEQSSEGQTTCYFKWISKAAILCMCSWEWAPLATMGFWIKMLRIGLWEACLRLQSQSIPKEVSATRCSEPSVLVNMHRFVLNIW